MKWRINGIVIAMKAVMSIAEIEGPISEDSKPSESDQAMVKDNSLILRIILWIMCVVTLGLHTHVHM